MAPEADILPLPRVPGLPIDGMAPFLPVTFSPFCV